MIPMALGNVSRSLPLESRTSAIPNRVQFCSSSTTWRNKSLAHCNEFHAKSCLYTLMEQTAHLHPYREAPGTETPADGPSLSPLPSSSRKRTWPHIYQEYSRPS